MAITRYNYSTKEMETFAVGRVVKVWTDYNYRIMSDIWGTAVMAQWWDGKLIKTEVVTVNDMGVHENDRQNVATVDATEEVMAEVTDHLVQRKFEDLKFQTETANKAITKGAIVQVVKGRKDKFKVGKVVYSKSMSYSSSPWSSRPEMKHCIALDNEMTKVEKYGKHFDSHKNVIWVWDHNLERLDVATVDEKVIMSQATEYVNRSHPYKN